MTAPEASTAMTLEEALLKLAETDHTLAFTDDENEPWVVVEKLEVDIATPYCRSWAEAVSHVWGYPVVEHDPTAELVEALAWLDEQLSEVQRSLRAPVDAEVLMKATRMSLPILQDRVRAALAKWTKQNNE